VVTADQVGDSRYAAAPQVTVTVAVAKAAQAITFPQPAGFVWSGGQASLTATASSALAVTFTLVSGPCALDGAALTATAAGSCVVSADQAGDGRYAAAPRVVVTVAVDKAPQTIAFAPLSDKLATDAPFALAASGGGSPSPVTFATTSPACVVVGAGVTLHGSGSCAITASQAGNANYAAAAPVTRTFNVALAPQMISFPQPAGFSWSGGQATIAATASSSLVVTFAVVSGPCSLAASTLTATGAGSCVLSADQRGDVRYAAAPQARVTVVVAKAAQAITFAPLPGKAATDAPFKLTATGGASGLPLVFATSSTACSLAGATLTLLRAGPCLVTVTEDGNADYLAATAVAQSFEVALAPQAITFPRPAGFSWAGGSATLAATASSGLAVVYSVVSGPCSLTGATLTATAAGACVVAADQGGDVRYSAAVQSAATVQVRKAAQTLTFAPLDDKLATGAPFTVSATGGASGEPVTFASASTACSVSGTSPALALVTLITAGPCAITASQAGTADYAAAAPVTRAFTVAKQGQSITFPEVAGFAWRGGAASLAATASSGLAVVYTVLSGPCAIGGATLTASAAGTCLVAADQPGSPKYAAAARELQSVTVSGDLQTTSGCAQTGPADLLALAGLLSFALALRHRKAD
jgi:hypothetical protein